MRENIERRDRKGGQKDKTEDENSGLEREDEDKGARERMRVRGEKEDDQGFPGEGKREEEREQREEERRAEDKKFWGKCQKKKRDFDLYMKINLVFW